MNDAERIARIRWGPKFTGVYDENEPNDSDTDFLLAQIDARDKFLAELPCPNCGDSKYSGQPAIYECAHCGKKKWREGTALDAFRRQQEARK